MFHIENANAVSSAYANLLNANKRLSEVIHHNEGITDKDLEKFAKEIIPVAKEIN